MGDDGTKEAARTGGTSQVAVGRMGRGMSTRDRRTNAGALVAAWAGCLLADDGDESACLGWRMGCAVFFLAIVFAVVDVDLLVVAVADLPGTRSTNGSICVA